MINQKVKVKVKGKEKPKDCGLARRALLIVTLNRREWAASAHTLRGLANELRTQTYTCRNFRARASASVAHAGRLLRTHADRFHLTEGIERELAAACGRQTCITDCSAHF
jgi:hypothetical protein